MNQKSFDILDDIELTRIFNKKTNNIQDSNKHQYEIKGKQKIGHGGATVLQIDTHKLV